MNSIKTRSIYSDEYFLKKENLNMSVKNVKIHNFQQKNDDIDFLYLKKLLRSISTEIQSMWHFRRCNSYKHNLARLIET